MKTFTTEEMGLIKNILRNASDETMKELFGVNYETVKAIIKNQEAREKKQEPYQFYKRFPDINQLT